MINALYKIRTPTPPSYNYLFLSVGARSMEEEYEIPVVYKNQQLYFKAIVLTLGLYTKKIQINVNGTEVLFEVDEERNYRAYINPTNREAIDKADKELLQAITEALESIIQ